MAGTHEPVAVLGMGVMGHGMAASALRAGIPTIVWNRTSEATRDLAELGAEVAETAADAARRAAIVLTQTHARLLSPALASATDPTADFPHLHRALNNVYTALDDYANSGSVIAIY